MNLIRETKDNRVWVGRDDGGAVCVYLAQGGWGDKNGGVKVAIAEDQIDLVIAWLSEKRQELQELHRLRAALQKFDGL